MKPPFFIRNHLGALIRVLWISCLSCGATEGAQSKPEQPTNVLMIMVDDLNDWIGCLGGHPQAITPHMDALASRGVLFTEAHCVAPACRPSRTAIFTGKTPPRTGAWSNGSPDVIADQIPERLLPGYFSQHGYDTLGTGKLFHGGGLQFFDLAYETEQRWSPFSKAQVAYLDFEQATKGSDHPRHLVENVPKGRETILPLNGLPSERNPNTAAGESFDWGPMDVEDEAMGDTRITDWATSQLGRSRENPFFMGVGYYRPHIPLFAPKRDFDAVPPVDQTQLPLTMSGDLEDVPRTALGWAKEPITAGSHQLVLASGQWSAAVRAYLASIHFVDRQIGRLIGALDASPHASSTCILLVGDHGWHLGEKQHWGKWTGWRESTRVPLIVVPPQGRSIGVMGSRCYEPVSLLDLYPTLLDICELPKASWVDGESLKPFLSKPNRQVGREVLTWFDPGNVALTTRQWRYLRYADGSEELYAGSNADPGQWFNLAGQPNRVDILERLRRSAQERGAF